MPRREASWPFPAPSSPARRPDAASLRLACLPHLASPRLTSPHLLTRQRATRSPTPTPRRPPADAQTATPRLLAMHVPPPPCLLTHAARARATGCGALLPSTWTADAAVLVRVAVAAARAAGYFWLFRARARKAPPSLDTTHPPPAVASLPSIRAKGALGYPLLLYRARCRVQGTTSYEYHVRAPCSVLPCSPCSPSSRAPPPPRAPRLPVLPVPRAPCPVLRAPCSVLPLALLAAPRSCSVADRRPGSKARLSGPCSMPVLNHAKSRHRQAVDNPSSPRTSSEPGRHK